MIDTAIRRQSRPYAHDTLEATPQQSVRINAFSVHIRRPVQRPIFLALEAHAASAP